LEVDQLRHYNQEHSSEYETDDVATGLVKYRHKGVQPQFTKYGL
jgi:hypothetical protein